MQNQKFILVGSIIGKHGLKGYLKVKSFLEFPDHIFKFNEYLINKQVFSKLSLKFIKKSYFVSELIGINNVEEANNLIEKDIFVKRASLPKEKKDEIYLVDLINYSVKLETGENLGKVIKFYDFGAGSIIETLNDKDKKMIPFSNKFILSIDQNFKVITLSSGIKTLLS